MGRAAFDLAIVSVLLDAGAGPDWRYVEGRTGETYSRSEGLAVASFDMFIGGAFSSNPDDPFRVDADVLLALTRRGSRRRFPGSGGQSARRVWKDGRRCSTASDEPSPSTRTFSASMTTRDLAAFSTSSSPTATEGQIKATSILDALLTYLGPIWPGRISLGGVDLGDTWRHPALETPDATNGLVPFHKLSQWLSYSLIEPLEWAGYTVVDLDDLTGLPEYRNGGLFLDTGVIALKDPSDAGKAACGRFRACRGMARSDGCSPRS